MMKKILLVCLVMAGLSSLTGAPAVAGCPDPAGDGQCGCMDIAFVIDDTGSMSPAINNVKGELAGIIQTAVDASDGDLRMALVTFKDAVQVDSAFTADCDAISALLNGLFASGGAGEPESSDEALNTVINNLNASDRPPGRQSGDFDTPWREECVKVAVLVTDARPGGFDDNYAAGVDDVNADLRAQEAAAAGILISAVYTETFTTYSATIIPIMQNYADTTGGQYRQTPSNGAGTGAALEEIIENCGRGCPDEPDPLSQGYWHRQCLGLPAGDPDCPGIDPGRNGRGPQSPTEPGFCPDLTDCADARLVELGFYGEQTCEGMDADPPSDPCERALKQLTALILNVCSGRLADGCEVDASAEGCAATTVGDLIDEAAGLILGGECQKAADCAGAVNEGYALVPSGGGGRPVTDEAIASLDSAEPDLPVRLPIDLLRRDDVSVVKIPQQGFFFLVPAEWLPNYGISSDGTQYVLIPADRPPAAPKSERRIERRSRGIR